MHTAAQTAPNGDSGPPQTFGGPWSSDDVPALMLAGDGRLVLVARGGDRHLYCAWQTPPGGEFGPWHGLGGPWAVEPTLVANAEGCLSLFIIGDAAALYGAWPNRAGQRFSGTGRDSAATGRRSSRRSPRPAQIDDWKSSRLAWTARRGTACRRTLGANSAPHNHWGGEMRIWDAVAGGWSRRARGRGGAGARSVSRVAGRGVARAPDRSRRAGRRAIRRVAESVRALAVRHALAVVVTHDAGAIYAQRTDELHLH